MCICECMCVSFLFFRVYFCVSVFCFPFFFFLVRVSGICDNRGAVLKGMGNVPLDGCHFFACHFSLPSQVFFMATSLDREELDCQKVFMSN